MQKKSAKKTNQKKEQKNSKINKPYRIFEMVFCLISAAWLALIYNFPTIWKNFSWAIKNGEMLEIAKILNLTAFNFWLCFAALLLLSFNIRILKFALIAMLFCSTISLYIRNKFGIIFDDAMLINALDSVGHTADAIDLALGGYFAILFAIPALFILRLHLIKSQFKNKLIIIAITLAISACFAANLNKQQQEFTFENFSPVNYLGSFQRYFSRFHKNRQIAQNRIALDKIFEFSANDLPENLNIIVVIGESLRADHMGINGYQRQTTPRLAKVKNLINFRSQARFNTTSPAITSLLSHRLDAEFVEIPPEKSLINLMKNLGFHTSWFSAQSSKEFGNGMLNIMALESDEYFFRDRLKTSIKPDEKPYDEVLLPFLKSAIKHPGKNFILLHSFGSHIRYHDRYPENFKKYQPECTSTPSSCDKQSLVNSYDNSVFYSDYFLSEAINSLKGTNSIMFFVSDHGNFLGENGQFANGNASKTAHPEHVVPMMIYATQELRKQSDFKQRLDRARANSQKMLNNDYFFDSILGCSGIKSSLIDKRKFNLCGKI